jgi:hypothetical protein
MTSRRCILHAAHPPLGFFLRLEHRVCAIPVRVRHLDSPTTGTLRFQCSRISPRPLSLASSQEFREGVERDSICRDGVERGCICRERILHLVVAICVVCRVHWRRLVYTRIAELINDHLIVWLSLRVRLSLRVDVLDLFNLNDVGWLWPPEGSRDDIPCNGLCTRGLVLLNTGGEPGPDDSDESVHPVSTCSNHRWLVASRQALPHNSGPSADSSSLFTISRRSS